MAERVTAFAHSFFIGEARDRASDDLLRVRHIAIEIIDDHLDSDRIMIGMPAIVISYKRHSRIANFSLARQLRFLKVSHSDDRHSERAINFRFRFRRKSWAFHADVSPAAMNADARGLAPGDFFQSVTHLTADRIGERDVRDYAASHGLATTEAVEAGLRDKAEEFRESGGEIYVPPPVPEPEEVSAD